MEKRKWITYSLTAVIIVLGGVLYSCRGDNKQETQVTLQNQENRVLQQDSQLIQKDTEVIEKDTKVIQQDTEEIQQDSEVNQQDSEEISADSVIFVHICGEVNKPNVYEVKDNTRLIDVIKLAGGLTDDAAGDYVNQAVLVEDGQQIYIPNKNEVEGIPSTVYTSNESASIISDKININTATMEQLMNLTGIGESKAKSIIAYRQDNGSFQSIEDIKNINGIKDSVFNKIYDMITVK